MYAPNTPYDLQNRMFYATIGVYYSGGTYRWDKSYLAGFTLTENLSNGNALAMGTINSSRIEVEFVQLTNEYAKRLYKGVQIKPRLTACTQMSTYPTIVTTLPSTMDTSKIYCIYNNDEENPYDYTAHQYIGTEWTEFTVQIMDTDLGVYYIDEVEVGEYHTPGKMSVKVTAYDGFYLTERKFTPLQNENPSIRSLIQSMASACGFSYTANDWSNSITVSSYPEDATVRTMIGYLAGLQGTCAYFARDGKLGAKWYTACAKHITRDEQYADSFVFGASSDSTGDVTIKYLESGTGDNIVVYPNNGVIGESISFENPLMDATRLQSIYTDKVSADGTNYKISYTPLSVKWRGNATIETGEIITVESSFYSTEQQRYVDNVCYIMERTMTYDGGFSEEYKCYGENEQTISFSTNVTMQKLERKLTNMEQAIEEATSVISQTEGSVFELISANDPTDPTKNAGWRLYSTINNNVILANSSGIGFSTNGGQSFNAASIYMDSNGGHIVATDIVAGQVSTDKLIVGTSTDPATLSALVNSTKQTADSAYGATYIPRFNTGGGQVARDYCLPQGVPSDFRIRPGATIIVHFTNSGKGSTTNAPKYLRVFHSATGTATSTSDCDDVYKNDGTLYGGIPGSAVITSVDLPIYYKGSPLKRNDSTNLWDANTDVAFTWSGEHWTMTYDIPQNNASAQSVLSTDNMKIAEYCSANDTTYINGGKIYTGSITATQIAANTITGNKIQADTITADKLKAESITTRELSVGWQSGNLASTSQWNNPDYNDSNYLNMTTDDDGNLVLTVKQSFTSSSKVIYSSPFFVAKGAKITLQASQITNAGASGSEIYLKLQKSSTIGGTYSDISDAIIYGDSSVSRMTKTVTIDSDCYCRLGAGGLYLNTNARMYKIYVFQKVTGDMIVTGSIKSTDGNTYFNLDTSEIVTQSGDFQSRFNSGGLIQYRKYNGSYYEMGYIQPAYSTAWYSTIAYKPSYSAGLSFGYDNGTYNRVVEITQGTASSGGIMTVASDRFCSVVNKRNSSRGTFYSKCGVGEVSDPNAYTRDGVSIALEDNSNTTIARLNVIPDWGAAGGIAIGGRGNLGGSVTDSAFLEMGTSSLYWNGALVSNGSSESLKKNITEYTGNATDLITSAKIYSFLYNEEDDKDPARYGVVIERECPTEIVEKTNKAVSVYSMTSMAWKAIQELNEKIEKLEAIVNDGNATK